MSDTKSKILDTALTLFNIQGERNVTTNHIAKAAGISPGNLYYHYRNKGEIVFELFQRYQEMVSVFLTLPGDRTLNWQDKMGYLENILNTMWSSRFFHRDLTYLLNNDNALREHYSEFVKQTLSQGLSVYEGLRHAGLLDASDSDLRALMVNTWLVSTNWMSFVQALIPPELQTEELDHQLLKQGIYQIVCLEKPYVRGHAATHLDELVAKYSSGDTLELLLQATSSDKKHNKQAVSL